MHAVLDTNIVLSGLLWQGDPRQILATAEKKDLVLYSTEPLLAELRGILAREKFAEKINACGVTPEALLVRYARLVVIVTPAEIPPTVKVDSDDDMVLAGAVGANADVIISGDLLLLDLKKFWGISILTPAAALELIQP